MTEVAVGQVYKWHGKLPAPGTLFEVVALGFDETNTLGVYFHVTQHGSDLDLAGWRTRVAIENQIRLGILRLIPGSTYCESFSL